MQNSLQIYTHGLPEKNHILGIGKFKIGRVFDKKTELTLCLVWGRSEGEKTEGKKSVGEIEFPPFGLRKKWRGRGN